MNLIDELTGNLARKTVTTALNLKKTELGPEDEDSNPGLESFFG